MAIKMSASSIVLTLFALCSCSSTDLGSSSVINAHTQVMMNGSVVQNISLKTNTYGLNTETAESWFGTLTQEGWDVTATSSSGILNLTAKREFSLHEFQSYLPAYEMVSAKLRINNYFVFREYTLNISLRALTVDEEGAVQDSLLQIIALALSEQRLTTSWSVTMPGTITTANTNTINGSSATWMIDGNNIMQGVPVTITSKCIYWPGVAGVIVGFLLVVALLVLLFRNRRKKIQPQRPGPGSAT
jgi:hypothetical protein